MEPLYWIFVVVALTLIFVVFAVSPIQTAIEEGVKNNAQLQAQRLASVINLMQTAPDGTTFRFDIPAEKCRVTITDSFVKLTITPVAGADISHIISLTKTALPVKKGEFECKANKNIQFIRRSGMLDIIFR